MRRAAAAAPPLISANLHIREAREVVVPSSGARALRSRIRSHVRMQSFARVARESATQSRLLADPRGLSDGYEVTIGERWKWDRELYFERARNQSTLALAASALVHNWGAKTANCGGLAAVPCAVTRAS